MNEQEIDALLADFRSWLREAAAMPAEMDAEAPPEADNVDLHTLLGQFVALRHEVNLQTRSSRGQQEQNAETLRKLTEALDALEQSRESQAEDAEPARAEILRPFLKTLVDVHDALALAFREVQRVQESLSPVLTQISTPGPSATDPEASLGFWARRLGVNKAIRAWLEAERVAHRRSVTQAGEAANHVQSLVASLVDGYTMSLQRLERTLEQAGLEAIPAVGEPFDPETMEVVEVIRDPECPGTEVVDEVRPGYMWQGRVFRFAQVRVARP